MSLLFPMMLAAVGVGVGEIDLPPSTLTVTNTAPGGVHNSHITFYPDGSLEYGGDLTGITYPAGMWNILQPADDIGSRFEIRWTNQTAGTSWTSAPAAIDTWVDISSLRDFRVNSGTVMEPGGDSITCDLELGYKGTSTAIYTLTVHFTASNS